MNHRWPSRPSERRPALPRAPRAPVLCTSDHCVTCSDEGVPLRVLTPGASGLAVCVDERGRRSDVMTELVGPVAPGDLLLVHAGTALVKLGRGAA